MCVFFCLFVCLVVCLFVFVWEIDACRLHGIECVSGSCMRGIRCLKCRLGLVGFLDYEFRVLLFRP